VTDNPVLSSQRQPEDADAALRPRSLGEVVGQEAALGSRLERTYTQAMKETDLPPDLKAWAERRIAEDGHADLTAYLGHLVLRDRDRELAKRSAGCKSPQS
jgi:hypothetical protein